MYVPGAAPPRLPITTTIGSRAPPTGETPIADLTTIREFVKFIGVLSTLIEYGIVSAPFFKWLEFADCIDIL